MSSIRNILVSFSLLAAGAAGFAQTSPGLLGQRYADVNFGVQDYRGLGDNAYSVGVGVNLPVTPMLDVGLDYSKGWLNTNPFDLRADTLSASATIYTNAQGVKPFAGAALGMQWAETRFPGFRNRDDAGVWALGGGVELPVGPLTFTPAIAYTDSFEGRSSVGAFRAGVEAHTWFTPKLGGYADVSWMNQQGSGGESWNYTVGLRWRF
jgi:hypothetical protein